MIYYEISMPKMSHDNTQDFKMLYMWVLQPGVYANAIKDPIIKL